ncbi:glycosyltransferase [Streptomyces sp. NPDC127166]|uniref:glycosyltransferase n=1 Tax=Streptomyces sp. NPDC127166 TaxID=3345380 RepID=UPI003630DECF
MPRARPSVSVIIPDYDYEKTLRACLASVFAQTHAPLDVIVVDDAGTDRSRDISREFGVVLIANSRNRGVSAARNTGAAAARGEVLFFLDSGTALHPEALAHAADLLRDDPGLGCVHGVLDHVRERLEDLAANARTECLSLLPGGARLPDTMDASRPLDQLALERGVKIRSIHQESFRNDPPTVEYVRWYCDLGGEARTVPVVPMQERESPMLLGIGCTDDIAARRLGVSLRTVRRMSSELMNGLGARSRFEAGVRATKEGWL